MKEAPSHRPTERRALRRAVDLPCEIITFDVDQPMAGRAVDLSPFGMWVQTLHPFAVGEEVVLCFRPPRWRAPEPLTLFGEVARVAMERGPRGRPATGLGVEFVGTTPAERVALARCLQGAPPPAPRHRGRVG